MPARSTPVMPEVQATWDAITYGHLCEGGDCRPACLESRIVFFRDGTWVRSAHDALDPLRQFTEEGSEGAADVMARYRAYADLSTITH